MRLDGMRRFLVGNWATSTVAVYIVDRANERLSATDLCVFSSHCYTMSIWSWVGQRAVYLRPTTSATAPISS